MKHYVISLGRTPERLRKFYAVNGNAHRIEHFEAVDGRTLDYGELEKSGLIRNGFRGYTLPSIGCALSHLALWEKAVALNEPVTIFEDDAVLNHRFCEQIEALIAAAGDTWDGVHWGWNFDATMSFHLPAGLSRCIGAFDQDTMRRNAEIFRKEDVAPQLFRMHTGFGLMAYTVSPAGAQKLINWCFPLSDDQVFFPDMHRPIANYGIDVMVNECRWQDGANFAVSIPPLAVSKNERAISTLWSEHAQHGPTSCRVCGAATTYCGTTRLPLRFYQCTACGFAFADAPDTSAFTATASTACNESDIALRASWIEYLFAARRDDITALACGPGAEQLAALLRDKGWRCDARERLDEAPARKRKKTYKLVLAFDVFEHAADPVALLRHMESLLAADGALLFPYGTREGRLTQADLDGWTTDRFAALHSSASLKLLFECHGYSLHTAFEPSWPALHFAYRSPPHFARGLLPDDVVPPAPLIGVEYSVEAYEALLVREPDHLRARKTLAFLHAAERTALGAATRIGKLAPVASSRILICVAVDGRRKIAGLVLEGLMKYKKDAALWVCNDRPADCDDDFPGPLCDRVIDNAQGLGEHRQRLHLFREFLRQDAWDYLYLTQGDALHDPEFIDVLAAMPALSGNLLPGCLYDSRKHDHARNNVRRFAGFTARRHAPGISHFYSKDMVHRLVAAFDAMGAEPSSSWDRSASSCLELPYLTATVSRVEYFGLGEDASDTESADRYADRALNPMPYLQKLRDPVIAYLNGEGGKPDL